VKDDATIRRCISLANRRNCGELRVANLFTRRSTAFQNLWHYVGDLNVRAADIEIENLLGFSSIVVVAWGAPPSNCNAELLAARVARIAEVIEIAHRAKVDLHCLGRTADGSPRHPVRLANDVPLEIFRKFAPV
jgi:hypothetical protein